MKNTYDGVKSGLKKMAFALVLPAIMALFAVLVICFFPSFFMLFAILYGMYEFLADSDIIISLLCGTSSIENYICYFPNEEPTIMSSFIFRMGYGFHEVCVNIIGNIKNKINSKRSGIENEDIKHTEESLDDEEVSEDVVKELDNKCCAKDYSSMLKDLLERYNNLDEKSKKEFYYRICSNYNEHEKEDLCEEDVPKLKLK